MNTPLMPDLECSLRRSFRSHGRSPQRGQALVEGLVVLLVLLSIWVGIAWLGRFQDMALQATHASRYAAFALSRDPDAPVEADMRRYYFSGSAHQWSDRRGERLLSPGLEEVTLRADRQTVLADQAQAGGPVNNAGILREQWHIEDTGILASNIAVSPLARSGPATATDSFTGLNYFDRQQLVMRRHTAILTGSGHASSDAVSQQVVADSALAWGQSAGSSYARGQSVAAAMSQVDAAWNRAEPIFDWLGPWAGRVPDAHLGN